MAEPTARTFEERVAMHAALAEPHRLAICDALALSDRSPSELAAMLGIATNLLAHHLLVLGEAGLIDTLASNGDRRRRYVRLRVAARAVVAPSTFRPTSVLFVCTQNSARSQFALALWRRTSTVPADSAGTHPAARVHVEARRTALRHGLDLSGAIPRAIDAASSPDLVVTVCDEANEEIRNDIGTRRIHWSIPDPASAREPRAFDRAWDAVASRVAMLTEAVSA